MSLSHALLGLLAVRPRSGYELTKVFGGDLGRYAWQAGHTSIYPELCGWPSAAWSRWRTKAPAAAGPTR